MNPLALALVTATLAAPPAGWRHEMLSIDEPVKTQFSASASAASDLLLATAVLAPLALQASQGWNGQTGQRALVYGETLLIDGVLVGVTKWLVARPRPYFYNPDPGVQAFAAGEGAEAHRSFYSGHAALAFASAVAGASLFARETEDTTARTAVWAGGLLLAGATANLRVRAGRHFYSDVLTGAVVGATVGWAVPALQLGRPPALALSEWVAVAAAPLVGATLTQLVPLPAPVALPLHAQFVPWLGGHRAGVGLAGRF
jgi:membrane-associated phospholipid phosphatase